jgi:cytochrome c oxidase cbb3-type subunit 3/ubiquinol-cytochrome c reductase cytochrome c subunit
MNRRSLTLAVLACAFCLAIAGCRSAPGKPGPDFETPRPDQVADFATLYAQNCAACHGVNGKSGAAISLANPVYLAVAGFQNIQHATAAGVAGTAMPPFAKSAGGTLTDQQISILTAGMEQKWSSPSALPCPPPPYAAGAPGNPAQGQKAFTAYCAQCHGADGSGAHLSNNTVTGSLVDPAYLALISDQGLRSVIIAGQTEQGPHTWMSYATTPPTRMISDQEITDIVAWLASQRIAAPGQPYQQHP